MNDFGSNISRCHLCNHRDRSLQGDVPCGFPDDGVAIAVHANAGWCPDGRFGVRDRPAGLVVPAAGTVSTVQPRTIRAFWATLHGWVTPTAAELAGLVGELPMARREQWDQIVSRRPVRWDDFPAWAVEIHDDLNELIGRQRHALAENQI